MYYDENNSASQKPVQEVALKSPNYFRGRDMTTEEQSTCPEEVRRVVLDILYNAAVSIRFAGWKGNARYCGIEADHIHNLPSLLEYYAVEKLRYYLQVECPSYLEQLKELCGNSVRGYEQHWQRLEKYL